MYAPFSYTVLADIRKSLCVAARELAFFVRGFNAAHFFVFQKIKKRGKKK